MDKQYNFNYWGVFVGSSHLEDDKWALVMSNVSLSVALKVSAKFTRKFLRTQVVMGLKTTEEGRHDRRNTVIRKQDT